MTNQNNDILDDGSIHDNWDESLSDFDKKIKIGRIGYFILIGYTLIQFAKDYQYGYFFLIMLESWF